MATLVAHATAEIACPVGKKGRLFNFAAVNRGADEVTLGKEG